LPALHAALGHEAQRRLVALAVDLDVALAIGGDGVERRKPVSVQFHRVFRGRRPYETATIPIWCAAVRHSLAPDPDAARKATARPHPKHPAIADRSPFHGVVAGIFSHKPPAALRLQ